MTEPEEEAEQQESAELTAYGYDLYSQYKQATEAVNQWEARRKELAGKLTAEFTSGRALVNGKHVFTRMPETDYQAFSSTRFRDAMPDLYRDFTVVTHRRASIRMVVNKNDRA